MFELKTLNEEAVQSLKPYFISNRLPQQGLIYKPKSALSILNDFEVNKVFCNDLYIVWVQTKQNKLLKLMQEHIPLNERDILKYYYYEICYIQRDQLHNNQNNINIEQILEQERKYNKYHVMHSGVVKLRKFKLILLQDMIIFDDKHNIVKFELKTNHSFILNLSSLSFKSNNSTFSLKNVALNPNQTYLIFREKIDDQSIIHIAENHGNNVNILFSFGIKKLMNIKRLYHSKVEILNIYHQSNSYLIFLYLNSLGVVDIKQKEIIQTLNIQNPLTHSQIDHSFILFADSLVIKSQNQEYFWFHPKIFNELELKRVIGINPANKINNEQLSLIKQLYISAATSTKNAPDFALITNEYKNIKDNWLFKLAKIPLIKLKDFNMQTKKILYEILDYNLIRKGFVDYIRYTFHFLIKFKPKKLFIFLKILTYFRESLQNMLKHEEYYEFLYNKLPLLSIPKFNLNEISYNLIQIMSELDFDISSIFITDIHIHQWFLKKMDYHSDKIEYNIKLIQKSSLNISSFQD